MLQDTGKDIVVCDEGFQNNFRERVKQEKTRKFCEGIDLLGDSRSFVMAEVFTLVVGEARKTDWD